MPSIDRTYWMASKVRDLARRMESADMANKADRLCKEIAAQARADRKGKEK